MLRVRLLGGLAVEIDGAARNPPRGRAAVLLAWLALHPGMHPRARLAAWLWPDVLDESARASLRNALLELRRSVGGDADDCLVATREALGLDDRVWVDVRAFARAVAEDRLEEAVGSGGGELLPELDEEWVYAAREEHRLAVDAVRERLAASARRAGDLRAAVAHARDRVSADPLGEEPARALIELLGAAGDRSAALAAYERHRESLRSELAIAPSAATRALVQRVRGDDTAPDAVVGQNPTLSSVTAARDLPVGTVTMLFTDIEGSTRLLLEHGESRFRELLGEHQRAVRAVVREHGGVEIGTQGDAFFVAFQGAADAVAAAVALQGLPADPIRIRIGIHTGEPQRHGDDYTGIDVHRAARICAAAHGGQIVLSDQTRGLLRGAFELTPLGSHQLKDLGSAEPLFQLGGADFPPLRSLTAGKRSPEPPLQIADDELVRDGREALAVADWPRARSCFERALETGETAEALEGLSAAAHFDGRHAEAIALKERAFAGYSDRDMRVEAARVARWLAFLHGAVNGNRAAANGWMQRAGRLLEGVAESVEHAELALDRAPWTDDPAERERHALDGLAIARRLGNRDLEFSALALLGHAYVVSGRVAEGMALIDEAMAAVSGGEVTGNEAIGSIYCRLLGACERATDVRRAEQWIAAARRFVAWGDFVPPTCRLHYGGILIEVGRWAEAEEELLAAARVFEGGLRAMRMAPLVRLAGLRVRQGRFEEAERLLEGSEARPAARQVLAAIAFGRGDLALAEDRARLCLDGQDVADPACVPLLELLVGIQLARDDIDAAREAVDRLTAIAADRGDERMTAVAELAAGRLGAATGDPRARSRLQTALEVFCQLELPLEAARAQLELARALVAEAPAGAVAEARLALAGFERLGAACDTDAAAELLRTLGAASGRAWPKNPGALTKRETEVLSLLAEGCSNAVIAERLFISRRTAEHHVARILSKLGLRSRAEAAAYAVRARSEIPVAE